MDCLALCRVSRISPGGRRARRVQRQVHVQSAGPARRLVRNAGRPRARDVSKFLLSAGSLAIHGRAPGARPVSPVQVEGSAMAKKPNTVPANASDALTADVLQGLKKEPKELSPVWFYDELG